MAISILLIVVFQAYWIRKLYYEEKNGFEKTTDVIFRESIYRLQADRFKNDTLLLKGMAEDNLFMNDVADIVKKNRLAQKDSAIKFMIAMSTDFTGKDVRFKKDTSVFIDAGEEGLHPKSIVRYLRSNKVINDTIPVKKVDSLYTYLLNKEGINVSHIIEYTKTPDNGAQNSGFATKKVPVGLVDPLYYAAVFPSSRMHILKNISTQLMLSLLLIGLTTISFIVIYRSLLAQRKLTDIKNEFIGNITHELKTPIATVSVAIEAMKNFNVLESRERTQEYLGIAGQELNRLSLLVDKVLRLSMFENKQVELKYQPFDFAELVEEVSRSMQLQFEKCLAVVHIHKEGHNFIIEADRMHIMSVVYNLLDNAIKYGGQDPEITMTVTEAAAGITFLIKDNGIGIDPVYIDRIFEKFFRVPHGNMHNVKGYGLGLSYAAHIIVRHGGTIKAESDGLSGTLFIIKLPRKNGN